MMLHVVVDADLVLEAVVNRARFQKEFRVLWDMMESRQIQGYITESGLDKIFNYVSQLQTPEIAESVVFEIQEIMLTCSIDGSLIQKARSCSVIDFESAVESVCALANNCGAIVTNNPINFIGVNLSILSVAQLSRRQSLQNTILEEIPENFQIKTEEMESKCATDGVKGASDLGNPWSINSEYKNDSGKSFTVSSDKLETEISNFLQLLDGLFYRAEQRNIRTSEMQLDEVELSVDITPKGEVNLVGASTKGAIKLKFKRIHS
ncbi:MAG: PIN domain-containing protein [Symploca sp. SIO3E6]|nr:PIN domain-containing protein [Caldora sp. SIO3E6]